MAYLVTAADLQTHIHAEAVDAITRRNAAIVNDAIMAAMDEARTYLGRYDLDKLLGTETADPQIQDANLKSKLKDLVRWQLIILGNPNIGYAAAEQRYRMAIDLYFMPLQQGVLSPPGWPYSGQEASGPPPGDDSVTAFSNPRRRSHW